MTATGTIDIWQPRWHDRVALVAAKRVREGDNAITFSRTPSLSGTYHMSGERIRSYPVDTNGAIKCYAVPLSDLVGEKQPGEKLQRGLW